jgi:hypothetical protein
MIIKINSTRINSDYIIRYRDVLENKTTLIFMVDFGSRISDGYAKGHYIEVEGLLSSKLDKCMLDADKSKMVDLLLE